MSEQHVSNDKNSLSMGLKVGVTALGLLVAGGATTYSCSAEVPEGERGVITSFGKVVRLEGPGLAFFGRGKAFKK